MLILLTLEGMFKIVLTDEEMSCVDLDAINYEHTDKQAEIQTYIRNISESQHILKIFLIFGRFSASIFL